MSGLFAKSCGFDTGSNTSPVSALRLRMIELLAFFVIVFVAKEIAGFVYESGRILLLFLGAVVLQGVGQVLWMFAGGRLNWPTGKINNAMMWYSSMVDLATVLGIVHFTGGVGSPFLLLLVIPLFFVSHMSNGRAAPVIYLAGAIVGASVLGYLEMREIIPHYNCYPFDNDVYLNTHFYVGSLLVLTGFLGLILFLSTAFQYRFVDSVNLLREKDKESKDKIQELSKLYDISLGINAVMTVETLLKMVAKEATLMVGGPWSSIVLFNSKQNITHAVTVGVPEDRQNTFVGDGTVGALTRWIAGQKKPVVIEDVRSNKLAVEERLFESANISSVVGIPLNTGQKVIGVVYVGDIAKRTFDAGGLRLLSIMCDQLVIAIAKSTLYESLHRKIERYETKIDELENVNQLKLEYVSHVSHELRTPLTSIKAYVETLEKHAEDPDFKESKVFLGIVLKETERLIRIVNDILDVSNIEFGERPLEKKTLSIPEIVSEVSSLLRPKLESKNIKLKVDLPEDLPRVNADRDLTSQVFINLINNAVKYSPEGTTITVRAMEEPVNVEIAIEDEGIGIPQAAVDKIFDRYYRVKSEKSRIDEGVGLGLAIVKNIIDRHGGTIHVESLESAGSKFVFSLPKEHCVNDLLGYLSDVISSKSELHEMLNLIVRMIAELVSAKMISLMLLDRTRSELFIKVSYGLDEWIVEQARVRVGEGIAGKVAETGRPLLIDNIENNKVHSAPNKVQYETLSLLSAPIVVNGTVVGVINVNNKISGAPFNQDDLNLLMSFGERISKALERLRASSGADMPLGDTVAALRKMVDRQIETKAIEKIVDLAVKTSRKLQLSDKEVKVIQYVASVHDIGMTKVSDDILNKTFHLSPEEIKQIQGHPQKGTDLMRPLEFVELVSNIILYHHERVDGLGYPMGLSGEDIPLGSRILAVIDAYQSMTMAKPYREPLTPREAIKELIDCAGRQFDSVVVDKFVEVLVDDNEMSKQQAGESKKKLKEVVKSGSY
jgi:signal transduction histidine kinase/HD-GYP domain-containing protein (c-di-GMP phosphodiesterase class II)